MTGHRNPIPSSRCRPLCTEAGFLVEHSRFFRNADTQIALCVSAGRCRSPHNVHKIRAGDTVVWDAPDKLASLHKNCLLVTASASKADTAPPIQSLNWSIALCQITPYPTCQSPRNNSPPNLSRSHEIVRRGTLRTRDFRPRVLAACVFNWLMVPFDTAPAAICKNNCDLQENRSLKNHRMPDWP